MEKDLDGQLYEVKLFRPEGSGVAYQERCWQGIVRMNRKERESLDSRCQRALDAQGLTTYSIVPVTSSIAIEELGRNLPVGFRELLGFGGPNALRMVP